MENDPILNIRSDFMLMAGAAKKAGLTNASDLLIHSLQDNPSNRSFNASSTLTTAIQSSNGYANIKADIATILGKNTTKTALSGNTSGTLGSPTDLFLALNKVACTWTADRRSTDDPWNVHVSLTDRYDFEYMAWKNSGIVNAFITLLNNWGATAQQIGAIVPYDITISMITYKTN